MSKAAIKECILAMTQERFNKISVLLKRSGKDFNTVIEIGRLAADTDEQLDYRLLAIANTHLDEPVQKVVEAPSEQVDFMVQELCLQRERIEELELALKQVKSQLVHRGFKSDSTTLMSIDSVLKK